MVAEQVNEALTAKGVWDGTDETLRYSGPWAGYDLKTGTVRDLKTEPVVADPTLVATSALRAAVSVAATLLTVEVSISLKRDHASDLRS